MAIEILGFPPSGNFNVMEKQGLKILAISVEMEMLL